MRHEKIHWIFMFNIKTIKYERHNKLVRSKTLEGKLGINSNDIKMRLKLWIGRIIFSRWTGTGNLR